MLYCIVLGVVTVALVLAPLVLLRFLRDELRAAEESQPDMRPEEWALWEGDE